MTWTLRALGALLMMWGFTLLLKPLVAVADVVPAIGPLLASGATAAAAILTLAAAPLIIAGGWLLARPLWLAALLALAALAIWRARRTAAAREAAPTARREPERTPTVSGPARPPRL